MNISDKAVEAALNALNNSRGLNLDIQARLALEAATPFIRAQAFQDAALAIRDSALTTHRPKP